MKKPLRSFLCLAFVLVSFLTRSQIAGVFTIPGNFANIAAAINTLNLQGVSGPVTVNIAPGYTETAPAGGFKLNVIAGTSATNTIIFKKASPGINPLIIAYAGTATPQSPVQDGVWWFVGTDYVTVDGVDITDPNASNPATMEFGYGFYKASATDGCQNNTIKNCVVTLNPINSLAGLALMASGSRGIEFVSATATQNTVQVTATSSLGTNSNNQVYANVLQNCHIGVALMGAGAAIPANNDQNNDVGGTSAVTGNTVVNFGGGNGSAAYGVLAQLQVTTNISNNVFNNNLNGTGATPTNSLAAIRASVINTVSINGNTITLSCVGGTVDLEGIYTEAVNSAATSSVRQINVTNNVFSGITYSATGTCDLIYDKSNSSDVNITANSFDNVSMDGGGFYRLIYANNTNPSANTSTCAINSNTFTNIANTNDGQIIAFGHSYQNVNNNLVDGAAVNNASCIISVGTVTNITVNNNTIKNVTAQVLNGINAIGSGNKTIIGNEIFNIGSIPTSTYGLSGTFISLGTGFISLVSSNSIYAINSVGSGTNNTGSLIGISSSGSNAEISKNKIADFFSNSYGRIIGMQLSLTTHIVHNNIIGNLEMTNSGLADAVTGLSVTSVQIVNVYYNTIYLNNTSNSGTNFGTAAFIAPTGGTLTVKNNIFVNTSLANGSGTTAAMVRSASSLTNYATSSNNNLFYAGTPSVNHVIFHDGTNTYSTLASFKALVAPREAQSVTENPPFLTTVGTATNFLKIDPLTATQVEGGALVIATYTSDYAGTARNTVTPDIGAWEGNYTQADVAPPAILAQGFTSSPCNLSGRTLTINISDVSGVAIGTLSPRIYYKVNSGLYTNAQGILSSGTATNGVWTFNMLYSAAPSDIIHYFIAMQDQGSLVASFTLIPSAGSVASDVNNVSIPPTSPTNYTIEAIPTVSVNSGNVCSGQIFTLVPSGAFTYTFSSGSPTVSPATNTFYTVTGSSPGGCLSSNTATAAITVLASPTVAISGGTICLGQSFTLNPSGANNYTYSSLSAVVSPTTTTSYSVAGTNSLNCISNVAVATVTVHTSGIVAMATSTSVCQNGTLTLNGSGGSGYTWSGGISNGVAFTPTTSGAFTVSGTGNNGCAGSASIQILVKPLPSVSLLVSSIAVCAGETATLMATGNASQYLWSTGENGSSIIVAPVAGQSDYTVTATLNGCTATDVRTLVVDPCTGIENLDKTTQDLLIYPNPNSGWFTLESSTETSISVTDVAGGQVLTRNLAPGKNIVHLDKQPAGVYFVRFLNSKRKSVLKIIVE